MMNRKLVFSSRDFLRGKVHLVIHPDEIKAALENDETVTSEKNIIKSPEALVRREANHLTMTVRKKRNAEFVLLDAGVTIMTKKETFAPKKQIHPSGFLV